MFEKYLPLVLFVVIFIALSIAFGLLSGRMSKVSFKKYDERQQIYRLKGYMYAFWILIIYILLYGFINEINNIDIFENDMTAIYCGIVISAIFLALYSNVKDSYISLKEKRTTIMVVFGLETIIYLGIVVFMLITISGENDFKLDITEVNIIFLFILFASNFVVFLFKTLKEKRNSKVEE